MWLGEYRFKETPVWDSARMLQPGMYRAGQYQCLSFGPGKPLDNTRGGAVLLDNEEHYKRLKNHLPPIGSIRALIITEKQYSNMKFLLGLSFGILAQVLTFIQLQGQFRWEWFKQHPWTVSLMGVPLSFLYIMSVRYGVDYFGGE
jgi:hypothetical protein